MVAPISLCMIVWNESRTLEACLKSIAPYVAEICIVDTGSTDNTPEIAKKYAHKFVQTTEFNHADGSGLRSFCDARNLSFSLATQPWVLWADGDDIVEGGHNLQAIVDKYTPAVNAGQAVSIFFEYEYSHDELGNPTCIQERERLVSPRSAFRWDQDVHEVLVPVQTALQERSHRKDLVYIHQKFKTGKKIKPDRNLRILKEMYEKRGESDARLLYYLGNEYSANGDYNNAAKHLMRYVELSGWDDERYMACLWLNEFFRVNGDYEKAIEWAFKAISLREEWGEGYFRLAKAYYYLAKNDKDTWRNWNRCIKYARQGLALPITNTPLFVNPLERQHEVHVYLNYALNYVGDVEGALESCKLALQARPNDEMFLNNKRVYETHLAGEALRKYGFDPKVIQGGLSNSNLEGDITSDPLPADPQLLLGCFRTLWKNLLLHDEVLSAERLTECAPWQIREHADVEMMRRATQSMSYHLRSGGNYCEAYSKDPVIAEAIPLPNPVLPEYSQKPRFDAVMNLLRDKLALGPVRYLDVGCHDGWLTNRAGLLGVEAYGVDCNSTAVDLANRKAEEFSTGAEHVQYRFDKNTWACRPQSIPDGFYDVISMLEVYEHIADMEEILPSVMAMLKPGGTLVLSTPEGSWLRGKKSSYNESWNDLKPREPVRAPTKKALRQDLERYGFARVDVRSLPVSQEGQRNPIPGQATLVAYAERPYSSSVSFPGLSISLYVGYHTENWNPDTVAERGIGGSETAVVEMAKRLVKYGHKVTVYNQCGDSGGTFDGVEYLDHTKFGPHDCDILITSRRADAVDFGVRAKATLCWVHDVHLGNALTHERALKIDRFFCLTHWHKDFFLKQYPFVHPSQVVVTRNGIDLSKFQPSDEPRNPHRAVYSSSPDRGLQSLLQMWPRIRQRVPDAELHVFYGFDTWEACSINNPDQLAYIKLLKEMLRDCEKYGVTSHGRVSQKRLASEFQKSGVWPYPTWFSETSCITAMEAQAAGLSIVTSPIAALPETVGTRGLFVEGDWLSESYQNEFVERVVQSMTMTSDEHRHFNHLYAMSVFNWDGVACDWDTILRRTIDEVLDNVVLPYQPAR